jgi:hypothetical protein
MCIAPCRLDDGTEVACRYCWQCKRNRVNDLVGRCIAESKFATQTYAVTLTYAQDAGVSAVTLVYKDVQDFLKRLRKRYKVRYIVAGEYGTKKGRAHWHIILFFKGKYPDVKQDVRLDWEFWKHGYSYFQKPDWKGFQYVLKYVLKDQTADSVETHLAMSKKPPLGYEFFADLAKMHVEQAVIPRSFKYKVGGVRKDNGQEKTFFMHGKTRDNFMTAFKEGWKEKYGKEPTSEFFEEWDEKNYQVTYTDEELIERLHRKDVRYFQPWVNYTSKELGTWTERNYQGIDFVIWENEDKVWIYSEDGQSWVEERFEFVDGIKKRSTIVKQMSYNEAQREEVLRLWTLLEETTPGQNNLNNDLSEFR